METSRSGARVTVAELLAPVGKSADFTAPGVDLSGYEGVVGILLVAAEVSGTTPTLTLALKDSADNSTFAATAATSTTGETLSKAAASSKISQTFRVDVAKFKRYLALDGDLGGTSPVYSVAAYIIGQKKYA